MIYGLKNELTNELVPPAYHNAEGEPETENEDYTEYEGEEAETDGGVEADALPKFRQLVRMKKLEMKAQYGKAHIGSRRECKQVPYPGFKKQCKKVGKKNVCINVPTTLYKEVCVNIPVWVPGWRKKWREFKRSGGLAQLKMQAKGLAPLQFPGQTLINTGTGEPIAIGPKGGKSLGISKGEVPLGINQGNVASIPGTAPSGISTTMKVAIAIPVVIGLGFGLYKLLK